MRKFVIKNRQKRKYTKKSEEVSSFSFSKTVYSMVPLLVMIIAFMSTMIISAPLRNAFTNMRFTFTLPQFSLTNPLLFFQILAADISQSGIFLWTLTQTFAEAIAQSFAAAGGIVTDGTSSLMQVITFSGNSIWTGCLFAVQEIANMIHLLGQFFSFIASQCIGFLRLCISFTSTSISDAATAAAKSISTITQLIAIQSVTIFTQTVHQIMIVFTLTVHFVTIVASAIINFFMFVAKTAYTLIISAASFIGMLITRTVLSIVHIIEIPFKILYAFWLQIKPYVDFFGKHVQMSTSDFSNMVTSMYRIAKLMGASK